MKTKLAPTAITLTLNNLEFAWYGGPYCEIFPKRCKIPFAVINVWDYALDVPRIGKLSDKGVADKLVAECREWIETEFPDWVTSGELDRHIQRYNKGE